MICSNQEKNDHMKTIAVTLDVTETRQRFISWKITVLLTLN